MPSAFWSTTVDSRMMKARTTVEDYRKANGMPPNRVLLVRRRKSEITPSTPVRIKRQVINNRLVNIVI